MAISLGVVALDGQAASLVWTDEFKVDPIAQVTQRTLGGQLVVYESVFTAGIDITLVATEDAGWLTKAQVQAIKALADAPITAHVLTIESQVFNVIFRHDEPPAVDFDPLLFRSNSEPGDFYTGTIKLRTV